MLRQLIHSVCFVQVALEAVFASALSGAKTSLRKSFGEILKDTLSDATELNELRADIATLRAELNEVKHDSAVTSVSAF